MNKKNLSYALLLIMALFCCYACEWNGVEEAGTEEEGYEDQKEDKVEPEWRVKNIAQSYGFGGQVIKNVAWWGYESGYQWSKGKKFNDNSELKIDITKSPNGIIFRVKTNVSALGDLPIVYDRDFNKNDEADYLDLQIVLKNNQTGKKIKVGIDEGISDDGESSFSLALSAEDFKDMKAGMTDFTVSFSTEYWTFFDKRSKVFPIKAEIKMAYQVPELYKTKLHFKSLRLNEEEVKKLLGDNDWNNSTPETGILVKYGDERVLFEYAANSFNYTGRHTKTIYHCKKDDQIRIYALDVDYGFNRNDVINDTIIYMKDLEAKDYIDLPMKYVDELLIYCEFKGRAN